MNETVPRSMTGKTVLITGGTGGIGRATAEALAARGAQVGIVGRYETRTRDAASEIARATGNSDVRDFAADMSSQAEVRRLAAAVLDAYPRLDVLINNVGGFWGTRQVTADGLERTFAVNHLAPFLLTNLLLDRLTQSAPSRVVTVSSGAQSMGRLDFDDLQATSKYDSHAAYNQSKLANVVFTYELARRLDGTNVTANTLRPGVVRTAFSAGELSRPWKAMLAVMWPFMKSPARGAVTSVYLASAPEVDGVTGRFFAGTKPVKSIAISYDRGTQERLWRVSSELVGLSAVRG
ncbi:SDR family oxidoreductase [Leifsonia sp. NPDC058248]|uniref:SDR family oxidoreductase n=1 Tax=Leifsonia sp. NPDC058248 TaxID=3346402 RepID=UPI0036D90D32